MLMSLVKVRHYAKKQHYTTLFSVVSISIHVVDVESELGLLLDLGFSFGVLGNRMVSDTKDMGSDLEGVDFLVG